MTSSWGRPGSGPVVVEHCDQNPVTRGRRQHSDICAQLRFLHVSQQA